MGDTIDRQAAIKDAESWVAVDEYEKHLQKNVVEWLKELPSAQPKQRRVDVENVLALLDGIHSSGRMEYYSDYCALYDAIAGLLPG